MKMESERFTVSLVKDAKKCYASICDRKAKVLGLCQAHYYQKKANGFFVPIRQRIVAYKDESGRVCTQCNEYKEYKEFYRTSNNKNYRAKCKECTIAINTISNRKRTQK